MSRYVIERVAPSLFLLYLYTNCTRKMYNSTFCI
nr:MAG TPA: hypothetical protein [Caudoviricetes sp.]